MLIDILTENKLIGKLSDKIFLLLTNCSISTEVK